MLRCSNVMYNPTYTKCICIVLIFKKYFYNEGVLKPMEKLDLPEKAQVRLTISRTFSKLLDDIGEIEAKEDTDKILEDMRTRAYYE